MISKQDFNNFDKQAQRWINKQDFLKDINFQYEFVNQKIGKKEICGFQIITNKYLEREVKTMISKTFLKMFKNYKSLKKIEFIRYDVVTDNIEEHNKYLQAKQSDLGTTNYTTLNLETGKDNDTGFTVLSMKKEK